MRSTITCIVIVVLLLHLPYGSKGETIGPGSVEQMNNGPMKKPDMPQYFIENNGQWQGDIKFFSETPYGNFILTNDSIFLSHYKVSGDVVKYRNIEIMFVFPNTEKIGRNGIGIVVPQITFFYGSNADEPIFSQGYGSVEYLNVWDGIDLFFHFDRKGLFKYDVRLSKDADPNRACFRVRGCDGLRLNEGRLIMQQEGKSVVQERPLAFTETSNVEIGCKYELVRPDTYRFSLKRNGLEEPIIIDPIINSTFLGGTDKDEFDIHTQNNVIIDDLGDVYLTGWTYSSDFPTTPGAYSVNKNGDLDVFICKMDFSLSKILFSTYLGGSGGEMSGQMIFYKKNLLVVGYTTSSDFPVTNDAIQNVSKGVDFFITILNKNGKEIDFSTYLGGSNWDGATNVIADSEGNIYVGGNSASDDFPMFNNSFQKQNAGGYDTVIIKINNDKLLVNSTYIGGIGREENSIEISIYNNSIIFASNTEYYDLPITSNALDKIISDSEIFYGIISINLTEMYYLSYFGQSESDFLGSFDIVGSNIIIGLDVDNDDYYCSENAFDRSYNGGSDCFIVKINMSGQPKYEYSSYVGGKKNEVCEGIRTDRFGNVLIWGWTNSDDLPIQGHVGDSTPNGINDGFFIMFDPKIQNVLYSSYIGGMMDDKLFSCEINGKNEIIMVGRTESNDFPKTVGAFDTTYNGNGDLFVMRYNLSYPPSSPLEPFLTSGDAFINLSWKEPVDKGRADIQYYNILRSTNNITFSSIEMTSSLFFNDSGLQNGKTYYYSIAGKNIAGTGNRSDVISGIPSKRPSPPVDLMGVGSDGLVQVFWEPSLDDGGDPVRSYYLYRAVDERSLELWTVLDNMSTQFVDEEITNGRNYRYAITATNRRGESANSNIVTVTPLGLPGPPRNVTLWEGDRYLELEWDTPQFDGGTEIEYQVLYKGTNISELSFLTSLNADKLEYNDTSVTNGVRYYYVLTCVNSIGDSARSNIVNGTPSGLPSTPLALKAMPHDHSVLLTWEHPLSNGGAMVRSYELFRNEKGKEFRSLKSLPSTQVNFTDNDVVNGILYHYKIRAVNDNGCSEFSSEVEALPLGPPTIPEPFIITSGNRFIEIGWKDLKSNGGDPTCKIIVLRAHGIGIDENNLKDHPELVITLAIVPATACYYNDSTPKNGIKYFYSSIAENKAGRSERSDWISSTSHGPPSIIENLTVGAENGIVELIWSKPIEDGGLPLISIEVHKRRGQEQTEKVIELDPDVTKYHDKDVRNGTFYHYYLISRNALWTSPPSIEVTVIHRGPPFPVQNLTVELLDGKVLIEWKAPESDGGYEITGYSISRQYNGGTFILLGNVGPNTCNWTDVSPPSGLNTYRVNAINGFGESGPSYSDEIRVHREAGHTKDQSWMLIVLGSLTLLVICVLTTLVVILKRREHSPDYTKGVQVTPPTDMS